MNPEKIAKLSSMFRNEGRRYVKDGRILSEHVSRKPEMCTYTPCYSLVQENYMSRHTKFKPEHDNAGQKRVKEIKNM